MPATRQAALVMGLSGLTLVAACASTDQDVALARTICEELRLFDDQLVDIANDSVAGIATRPPDERRPAINDGLERADQAIIEWQATIADIELPDLDEAEEVRTQLATGAESAKGELEDERNILADEMGPIEDREVQGAVGGWFNSIEKVMSVLEPEVFKLERRELKQAFLDEAACRHVIQQFRND